MWQKSDKYKGKYRIPSNRLQRYDYGANGCYYVTICTKNREHYFGEIVNEKLQLSEIGKIALQYWLDIPKHFPFVGLDEFIIMPNHIHGILFFDKKTDNGVTDNAQSEHPPIFGCQSQNLGSVIRGFKSSLKRYANENDINFSWQERFHDHIIRDNDGLINVRKYILNNPPNWTDDELNEPAPANDTNNVP